MLRQTEADNICDNKALLKSEADIYCILSLINRHYAILVKDFSVHI